MDKKKKYNTEEFSLTKQIYYDLNKPGNLKNRLQIILANIKRLTDIEAISIRLHDHGDYPYYVYDGFSNEFILHENELCAKDEQGLRILNPDQKTYLLECMCGNVIRQRVDSELKFFTENGSFFSNHTSQLLAETTDEDRQAHTRNYCNSCGFESVALIPLKYNGTAIGLLQLNDHRQQMFTQDVIEFLEFIGEMIAQNVVTEPDFDHPAYISTHDIYITICMFCKCIKKDNQWIEFDQFLSQIKNTRKIKFTHGLCPQCLKKEYKDYIG